MVEFFHYHNTLFFEVSCINIQTYDSKPNTPIPKLIYTYKIPNINDTNKIKIPIKKEQVIPQYNPLYIPKHLILEKPNTVYILFLYIQIVCQNGTLYNKLIDLSLEYKQEFTLYTFNKKVLSSDQVLYLNKNFIIYVNGKPSTSSKIIFLLIPGVCVMSINIYTSCNKNTMIIY